MFAAVLTIYPVPVCAASAVISASLNVTESVGSEPPLIDTEPSTTPSIVSVLAVFQVSAVDAFPKNPAAAPVPDAAVICPAEKLPDDLVTTLLPVVSVALVFNPSSKSALRLLTLVVDATTNGATP